MTILETRNFKKQMDLALLLHISVLFLTDDIIDSYLSHKVL